MSRILVSGLTNLETTLRIDGFPIPYQPVSFPFFGVRSSVSGVGFNVAKALTCLGDQVQFLTMIAGDAPGKLVLDALENAGIATEFAERTLQETAQSVITYDGSGRRAIHLDLKDIQEKLYPLERFCQALQSASLAVLCNINFSRPFLDIAREERVPIATDVHAISNLQDPYNQDFMAAADILFLSHENLPIPPEEWLRKLWDRYSARIVVIGLGEEGALLGERDGRQITRFHSVITRPIVNTIGAGDALFSAFVHFFHHTGDAYTSLKKAILFASYKIGERGAADGFLDEAGVEALFQKQA